jgi:hypothetical protein
MSKGKYKRKREHRQNAPQNQLQEPGLLKSDQEAKNSKDAQSARQDKEENFMRFGKLRELWKQCSLTDRIIAVFTAVLAAAAIYQFIILDDQLDVMRKDQRAWMDVQEVGFQNEVGKPIAITMAFRNTGKTPAMNVYMVFKLEMLNIADGPTFDYSNKHLVSEVSGTFFPNTPPLRLGLSPLIAGPGTDDVQGTVLTQDVADKFKNGQIWYAAHGRVSYEDIFGGKHWMTRCFLEYNKVINAITSAPLSAKPCANYEHIDKN